MNKIRIVLFSYVGAENVIDKAFELLDADGEILISGIIEDRIPVLKKLISNTGFLGNKVSNDLEHDIAELYKNRANRILKKAKRKGEKENVAVETSLITADSLFELDKKLKNEAIGHLLINYTRDKFFSKVILNYSLADLIKQISISYTIYYEGEIN